MIMDGYSSDDANTSETTYLATMNPTRRAKRRKGTDWRRRKLFAYTLAICVPVLFPVVHMYIFICQWGQLKPPVDSSNCRCSCWDTIFKGSMELGGVTRFKHVYFNSDMNTLKMWMITVLMVIFLYESFRHLFLLLLQRKLRWTMVILFLSSLYSHYYAWWNHWNYWNDDFYDQLLHQTFYTVSELVSTVIVLRHLDVKRPIRPLPMLIVCSIAVSHFLFGSWDQFISNVIYGKGQFHQVIRDILLMTTDLMHEFISFFEVWLYATRKGITLWSVLVRREHQVAIASVFIGMLVFFVVLS